MQPRYGGPTIEATLICQQSSSHLLAQPPYMISLLSCEHSRGARYLSCGMVAFCCLEETWVATELPTNSKRLKHEVRSSCFFHVERPWVLLGLVFREPSQKYCDITSRSLTRNSLDKKRSVLRIVAHGRVFSPLVPQKVVASLDMKPLPVFVMLQVSTNKLLQPALGQH